MTEKFAGRSSPSVLPSESLQINNYLKKEEGHSDILTAWELVQFGFSATALMYATRETGFDMETTLAFASLWVLPSVVAHFSEGSNRFHEVVSQVEGVQFMLIGAFWLWVTKLALINNQIPVGVFSSVFGLFNLIVGLGLNFDKHSNEE